MRRSEETHEFEAKVLYTSAKSRLIELTMEGTKYWLPKKCTYDFNASDDQGNFMIVVNDWWWNKRADFEANDET